MQVSIPTSPNNSGSLTLFVTVFANLRMSARLPFSQSIRVYICRILTPSCFFVSVFDAWLADPTPFISSAALLGAGVLDRLNEENGLGVRGRELAAVWKA